MFLFPIRYFESCFSYIFENEPSVRYAPFVLILKSCFAGFQAEDTLVRRIVDGMEHVRGLGEDIAVRARVYTIGGLSAHADQKELLEWLGSSSRKPEIFIVHGQEKTALEFEGIVEQRLGLTTHVPCRSDEFGLWFSEPKDRSEISS
jgi:predicted metal-dependent RNase